MRIRDKVSRLLKIGYITPQMCPLEPCRRQPWKVSRDPGLCHTHELFILGSTSRGPAKQQGAGDFQTAPVHPVDLGGRGIRHPECSSTGNSKTGLTISLSGNRGVRRCLRPGPRGSGRPPESWPKADQTNRRRVVQAETTLWWLRRGGVIVDAIGQIGVDPGTPSVGTGAARHQDNTLRPVGPDVCTGDPDCTDPSTATVEWGGLPPRIVSRLGSHVRNCDDGERGPPS